jgi:K+ potassium transporter
MKFSHLDGVTVCSVMLITTVFYMCVMSYVWNNHWIRVTIFGLFLIIDLYFLAANVMKFFEGNTDLCCTQDKQQCVLCFRRLGSSACCYCLFYLGFYVVLWSNSITTISSLLLANNSTTPITASSWLCRCCDAIGRRRTSTFNESIDRSTYSEQQ